MWAKRFASTVTSQPAHARNLPNFASAKFLPPGATRLAADCWRRWLGANVEVGLIQADGRMLRMSKRALAQRVGHFSESVIREMTRLAQQHGAINHGQGMP